MSISIQDLKATVLAAGNKFITDDQLPVLLQDLAGKKVIDYVIENAVQFVKPADIRIVVGYHQNSIRDHLGDQYSYVIQAEPHGTGEAVLALKPWLQDFQGDLLILYGDTPLFSAVSIRGLINRHRLCRSNLTLLTAITDQPYPYGRVIRAEDGKIVDIIEDAQASEQVKNINELNAGAYIVSVPAIWEVLEQQGGDGIHEQLLTDAVRQLIHCGLNVESYQIYDQDEIQGINTRSDLEKAEYNLQKRSFQPRQKEERNIIQFGTGGWRAVIGEGFTLLNVRRLSQALANEITRQDLESRGVLIGYDRRFLSDHAAKAAAEVFAGNNIHTVLLREDAPTPLIEFATTQVGAAYGLAFTASHNPPNWNGVKVFHGNGALLLPEETNRVETETNLLTLDDVIKVPSETGLAAGILQQKDFTNAYVDRVESFIDINCIRNAGLKVIVDPMYGVGHLTLGIILNDMRCRVSFIHERHNPLFGGRSPAPDLEAIRMLRAFVRDEHPDLGLATDGDADRIAVVDEKGNYISANDMLVLIYWYLHELKGMHGPVIRNLSTTHMLDRLASMMGESCIETPVGFKWISAAMIEHNALLGGESSGGLAIRGHILGKDGIFASAIIIEMLAKTGQHLSELIEQVRGFTGRLYMLEENVPATAEMRIIVPQLLKNLISKGQAPFSITRTREDDGIKLFFEGNAWTLLRFSGTEPVLRLTAEADSTEKAHELLTWLKNCIEQGGYPGKWK